MFCSPTCNKTVLNFASRKQKHACKSSDAGVLALRSTTCLLQLLVHQLGGEVATAHVGGEYGRMPMTVVKTSRLYSTEEADTQLVWMSHGDEAVKLPEGFSVVARSEQVRGCDHSLAHACGRHCRWSREV